MEDDPLEAVPTPVWTWPVLETDLQVLGHGDCGHVYYSSRAELVLHEMHGFH